MLAVVRGLVLVVALALVEMASASDELYRCSDGTFTNRVERQCQPYESTGMVRVQIGRSNEPKSTVKKRNADEYSFLSRRQRELIGNQHTEGTNRQPHHDTDFKMQPSSKE